MALPLTLSNSTVAADAPSGTVVGTFNQDGVRFQGATRPDYLLIVGRMLVTTWDVLAMVGPIPIQVHASGAPAVPFTITIIAPPLPVPTPPPPVTPPPAPPPVPQASPDGTVSGAPSGAPLVTASGNWTWGSAAAGRPGEYNINRNGAQAGIGLLMEVANGGKLYVNTAGAGWYVWNNGFSGSPAPVPAVPAPPPTPAPSPPPPPPPPATPAPIITFAVAAPVIPDNTPKGAVVDVVTVKMSDGSPFAGTLAFGAPNFDNAGVFSLSAITRNADGSISAKILVNPAGPGVGPNAGTITDHVTITAVMP